MTLTASLAIVSTVQHAAGILTQLLGLAAMAALLAGALAVAYRWYAGVTAPRWLGMLVGLAGVALYLGTTPALESVVREGVDLGEASVALFNVGGLLFGTGGALLGYRVGDRFGADVLAWEPEGSSGDDVGALAQTFGQVTTVQLPATIHDTPGYDPVPERTKETLRNETFVFPRGLSVEELRERLTNRLRSDYGVGAIDVEFDDAGDVAHLGVGTRAAGIGATLPPATNAVAVRADPGYAASTGDIVQLWDAERLQRVLTGELRGVADDVVTVAIDAADTSRVDPTRQYRLVTLPVDDRPDREFASLLRAAEETFSSVTVEAGSPLHGMPVGALDLTVTAIRPEDGDAVAFPEANYRLAPGDLLFVIARPAGIRRLETAAEPLDPSLASTTLPADQRRPTEGIQTADSTDTQRDEPTGEDGLPATDDESGTHGRPTGDAGSAADEAAVPDDGPSEGGIVSGKADGESFKEIKAQFERRDAEREETTPAEATEESATGSSSDEATATGEPSFDELKAEFDSGEAAWDEEPEESVESTPTQEDGEVAFDEEESEESELVGLDEAEIDFGDDEPLGEAEIDEDRQGEPDDAISDDIGDLDVEDESGGIADLDLEEDSGLFDIEPDEEDASADEGGVDSDQEDDGADTEDEDADEDGDDDDDAGGGGGGSSFAELKAEFESGDADWEDDIDDSPGGDMRLDE